MASVQRDEKIAPAILELAETHSITRALRFAGFGMESCTAEEISHLEICSGDNCTTQKEQSPNPQGQSGGNGDIAKITERQRSYIQSLAKSLNYTWHQIEE